MADNNRDLYQWDGSDAGQPARPQGDGGAQQRFRDEAYNPPAQNYQPQQHGYPREYRQPGRGGGDNVMVVYGDVYVNQGGNDNCYRCRRRSDGRDEYYGRGYDYSQYSQPGRTQVQTYQDYGYRQAQPQPNYYERSGGYYYRDGGANYQRQGPTYSRDSVHGGRDGYSADRERYNAGYERQYGGRPYNQGGCFGGGGGGGGGGGDSYPSDWDRAAQVFDFALKGADTYFGYDIARRHAKGQYQDGGRNYQNYGGGGRGGPYRSHQSVPYRR